MNIGIVGGTGREGRGIALRWAKAGHRVTIGSRDATRGAEMAAELSQKHGVTLHGTDNAGCCEGADVVLLAIPYGGHGETLRELKPALEGKIVIDITVPLKPPQVRRVHLPEGQAAALETQALLEGSARVVAAMHHVSAVHLASEHAIDCDVLVCSDDEEALQLTLGLIRDLGMRGVHAGVLANAVALESLTPVLLHINKHYKNPGVGLRITGL